MFETWRSARCTACKEDRSVVDALGKMVRSVPTTGSGRSMLGKFSLSEAIFSSASRLCLCEGWLDSGPLSVV